MSTVTKLSLLANAALAGLVVWLSRPEHFRPASATSTPAESTAPEIKADAPSAIPSTTAACPTVAQPFNWSQLESTDYPTYIANLRRIGCPEQTIRDIMAADLDSAYYARRRQVLEQSIAAAGATESTLPDALANEMRQLENEESGLVTRMLTDQAGSAQMASANAGTQNRIAPMVWASPASQPGAIQKAQPGPGIPPAATSAGSVSPTQPTAGTPLASNPVPAPVTRQPIQPVTSAVTGDEPRPSGFSGQSPNPPVGGLTEDPDAAALRQKWELARRNADYSLRGLIGSQRYLEYVDQQYLDAAAQ